MYEYQGQKFQLPDGLTVPEAKQKILDYLATEKKPEEEATTAPASMSSGETSSDNSPEEAAAIKAVQDFLGGEGASEEIAENERQYDPTKDEGVAQELVEGVASGAIGIGQGIAELGAGAVDSVAGTDYASSVTQGAETLRTELGIDPVGLVGKGAEIITQFVVPGAMAVGAVSKLGKLGKGLNYISKTFGGKGTAFSPTKLGRLSEAARKGKASKLVGPSGKLTKGQKFGLLAQQATAAGAAEFVVATDGITTIGDFFEGGPTQTNQETGLEGRENGLRILGNKLAIAGEAAAITAAAPPILTTFFGGLATVTRPATQKASRFILEQGGKIGNYNRALEEARKAGTLTFKGPSEVGVINSVRSVFETTYAELGSALRYRGMLPDEAAEVRALTEGMTKAEVQKATNALNRIENNLETKILSKYAERGADDSDLARQSFFNQLEDFMTAATPKARTEALNNLPDFARSDAAAMRQQVDSLSQDLLNSDFIKKLDDIQVDPKKPEMGTMGDRARAQINKNMGQYIRRRYEAFENARYSVSEENFAIGVKGFKENKADTIFELRKILKASEDADSPLYKDSTGKPLYNENNLGIQRDPEDVSKFLLTGTRVSKEQAELAAKNFLERKRLKNRTGHDLFSMGSVSRTADLEVDPKLFLERTNIKDFQRALLGEIKDPREAFLGTVADLAQFRSVDRYFGRIRQLATETAEQVRSDGSKVLVPKNPGFAGLFKSTENLSPKQKENLVKKGFVILGGDANKLMDSPWGSLDGFAVRESVYRDLTRLAINDDGTLTSILKSAYGGFLKVKGYSQYAKTVLSPTTQVRNVTTAGLFATMQGNVGRGANLGESIDLVFNDIRKLPPRKAEAELFKLQRLGIIGSQAELREIQALISKGVGTYAKQGGRQFGSKFTDNALGNFVSKAGKGAENLYQGGDNVWKIYNFNFERSKLKNALRSAPEQEKIEFLSRGRGLREVDGRLQTIDDLLDEEAARVVRDTVPNYNLAPRLIKELRGLPVGNFIAFPAEIIRTGTNSITRALEEMASNSVEIQKIGQRRMTGIISTTYLAPTALYSFAQEVTGVTDEQMAAHKRSLGPDYEKNALLIPTGRDEDGMLKYINYSYSNPYDIVGKIAQSALNEFEASDRKGESIQTAVTKAASGALGEFFEPFLGQSMVTEALLDVTLREGRRDSGARIYQETESNGEKFSKGFAHVANTVLPTGVPFKFKGTTQFETLPITLEPSNSIRGLVNTFEAQEFLDISGKDRRGLEKDLTEELARSFSGIVENKSDMPLGLQYKGFRYSSQRRIASGTFNAVARRKNSRASDFVNAYKSANEQRFRVYQDMHNVVQDMRTLGLDDGVIEEKLREIKAGDVGFLLDGEYKPLEVSKDILKVIDENDTADAWADAQGELGDYIDQQYERKYATPSLEEGDGPNDPRITELPYVGDLSQAEPTITPAQPVAAAGAPPPVAQAGGVNPLASPAASTITDPATLSAILPNPRDRVLAERLRGTT